MKVWAVAFFIPMNDNIIIKKEFKGSSFLVVMQNGYGKRTEAAEYKTQKRGGSGIKTAKVTLKIGKLIVAKVLTGDEEELIAMSKKGMPFRSSRMPSLLFLGYEVLVTENLVFLFNLKNSSFKTHSKFCGYSIDVEAPNHAM